jgi:hypothetical protein
MSILLRMDSFIQSEWTVTAIRMDSLSKQNGQLQVKIENYPRRKTTNTYKGND